MRFILLVTLVQLISVSIYAQKSSKLKVLAKSLFAVEKYEESMAALKKSRKLLKKDKEAQFIMAVCHYEVNDLTTALAQFKTMTAEGQSPYPECWLYMGKIYHNMHQFDKAVSYYKLYLKTISKNHKHRDMVVEDIRRCSNGIQWRYRPAIAVAENLGASVNSEGDEFAPIISPNRHDKLYFSASREGCTGGTRNANNQPDEQFGHYYSDIFSAKLKQGVWKDAQKMSYFLNSPKHERLLDFGQKGKVMYFYQGWKTNQGRIVVDTFASKENLKLNSTPFLGPISMEKGDINPVFYNDTLLYFASNRPGGYGGYDIYTTSYRDGIWTKPKNLGEQVNSAFDEISPFISRNGLVLYYSTNNSLYSVGGFDVVKSAHNPATKVWSVPYNVGIPINSAGDDMDFRIAKDGFSGFFASSRKDGLGKRDLYAVYFQDFLPEMEPPAMVVTTPRPSTRPTPTPPQALPTTSKPKPTTHTTPSPAQPKLNPPPAPQTKPTTTSQSATQPLRGSVTSAANIAVYKDIKKLQQKHSGSTIIISAYIAKGSQVNSDLSAAIQQAEKIGKWFVDNGIRPSQVTCRALTTDNVSGSSSEYRITLGGKSVMDKTDLPVFGTGVKTSEPTERAQSYKIQISSGTKLFKGSALATYADPMVEKNMDFKYYRYTVGAFSNIDDANSFKRKVRKGKYTSAYVVTYFNGLRK